MFTVDLFFFPNVINYFEDRERKRKRELLFTVLNSNSCSGREVRGAFRDPTGAAGIQAFKALPPRFYVNRRLESRTKTGHQSQGFYPLG